MKSLLSHYTPSEFGFRRNYTANRFRDRCPNFLPTVLLFVDISRRGGIPANLFYLYPAICMFKINLSHHALLLLHYLLRCVVSIDKSVEKIATAIVRPMSYSCSRKYRSQEAWLQQPQFASRNAPGSLI